MQSRQAGFVRELGYRSRSSTVNRSSAVKWQHGMYRCIYKDNDYTWRFCYKDMLWANKCSFWALAGPIDSALGAAIYSLRLQDV